MSVITAEDGEGLLAIAGKDHSVTGLLQMELQHEPDLFLVVCYENALLGHSCTLTPAGTE